MAPLQRNWLENSRIKELFPIFRWFFFPLSEPYPARFGGKLKIGGKACGISQASFPVCEGWVWRSGISHPSDLLPAVCDLVCEHLPFWAESHPTLEGSVGAVTLAAFHAGFSFFPLFYQLGRWNSEFLEMSKTSKPLTGLSGTVMLLGKDGTK